MSIPGTTCTVVDCTKPLLSYVSGLCNMHATRLRRTGSLTGIRPRLSPQESFDKYTPDRPADGCWEWAGARHSHGYGVLSKHHGIYAHRWSYERHHGLIPPNMHVRHRCDNPPCVNPAHLLVGTAADNAQDKVDRGRQVKGEHIANSVLTEADVVEIRILAAGGSGPSEIAQRLGHTRSTVDHVMKGRSWRHVPIPECVGT